MLPLTPLSGKVERESVVSWGFGLTGEMGAQRCPSQEVEAEAEAEEEEEGEEGDARSEGVKKMKDGDGRWGSGIPPSCSGEVAGHAVFICHRSH